MRDYDFVHFFLVLRNGGWWSRRGDTASLKTIIPVTAENLILPTMTINLQFFA